MVDSSTTAMIGQTQTCRRRNEPAVVSVRLIERDAQVMWALRSARLELEGRVGIAGAGGGSVGG